MICFLVDCYRLLHGSPKVTGVNIGESRKVVAVISVPPETFGHKLSLVISTSRDGIVHVSHKMPCWTVNRWRHRGGVFTKNYNKFKFARVSHLECYA